MTSSRARFAAPAGAALLVALIGAAVSPLLLEESSAPGSPAVGRARERAGEAASQAPAIPAAAGTTAPALSSLDSTGALRVRVTDRSGTPLAGARVALRVPGADAALDGARCDAEGRCQLTAPAGPLELLALAEGYLIAAPRRLEAAPTDEVRLELTRGAGLELLVEREDGAPLGSEGAQVVVLAAGESYLAPDAPLRTDPIGRLRIEGLPPEGGELLVSARGCGSARLALPAEALPMGSSDPLRLVLPVLRLTVELDPLGVAPGPDLTLELRGGELRAGSTGGALRRLPFTGTALSPALEAEGEGWARLVQADAASPWRRFEVSASQPHAQLRLTLGAAAPIGGLVVDPEGEPLADVTVTASDAGGATRTTRSGADGRFQLEVRAGEEWWVEARRPGCTPARARCTAPEPLLVLVLTPTVRVVGRPFLGPDGQPLRGRLDFDPGAPDPHHAAGTPQAAFQAELLADGRIDLQELPAGTWTISLLESAPNELRVWVLETTLEPGQEVALGPPPEASQRHALDGHVQGATPGEVLKAELRPADPRPDEQASDAFAFVAVCPVGEDGSFRFAAVPPGRYVIRATLPNGLSEAREVEIPGTQRVELRAQP